MSTVVDAGTPISNTSATPAVPVLECHTCRQVTNYSPNLWMCVGNYTKNFNTTGAGSRRSDLAWASDGASGSKKNAGYVGDPFGYDILAPTNQAGQPLSVGAQTLVQNAGFCFPPFSQATVDVGVSPDNELTNLVAVVSPFDEVDPSKNPARYLSLSASTTSACSRNIGTCATNQQTQFQRAGGDNADTEHISDDGDTDDACNSLKGTFPPQPAATPPPRNLVYGAFDTSGATIDQGWQNRQSILSLAPGLGGTWTGARYMEETGNDPTQSFGCVGGCHGSSYAC